MLPDVSHLLFTKQLHILVIGLDSSRVTGTSLQRKKLPMVVSDPLSVMMLCGWVMELLSQDSYTINRVAG